MTVRVYHPVTSEAFDVPRAKADDLLLTKGWTQTRIDPKAVPAVQDARSAARADARGTFETWRR